MKRTMEAQNHMDFNYFYGWGYYFFSAGGLN
jgi:hypothetical protein